MMKYCVNGKPPYFKTLREARLMSLGNPNHKEVLGDNWTDQIMGDGKFVGSVSRIDGNYLWSHEEEFRTEGYLVMEILHEDGTTEAMIDELGPHVSPVPIEGWMGINLNANDGQEARVWWVPGGLCGAMKVLVSLHGRDDEFIRVVNDKEETVGYFVTSGGRHMYGCAELGWRKVNDNGVIGKMTNSLEGGPRLDMAESTPITCSREKFIESILKLIGSIGLAADAHMMDSEEYLDLRERYSRDNIEKMDCDQLAEVLETLNARARELLADPIKFERR